MVAIMQSCINTELLHRQQQQLMVKVIQLQFARLPADIHSQLQPPPWFQGAMQQLCADIHNDLQQLRADLHNDLQQLRTDFRNAQVAQQPNNRGPLVHASLYVKFTESSFYRQ